MGDEYSRFFLVVIEAENGNMEHANMHCLNFS